MYLGLARFASFAALSAVALTVSSAAQAQVNLSLLKTVSLTSTFTTGNAAFIGSNPSALAWNGTSAWLGGYNQSGAVGTTAIVQISNVLTGTTTFGTAFGQINTTPNSRGLTSLAIQGSSLYASLDTGAGNANSVRAFDAATGTSLWAIGNAAGGNDSTRRGDGVAIDPGFNGGGTNQGVSYLSIGSGRRHLLNSTTGAYLNGQNAGAIVTTSAGTSNWRDLAFNPVTGDLYARESNRIASAIRTADNNFGGSSAFLGNLTVNAAVDNNNIAFVNALNGGNFLIVNDRVSAANGQSFSSVVKAFDLSGNQLSLTLGGFAPLLGNAAYDFAFDSASQTLAVSDFANRELYVFAVNPQQVPGGAAPEPASGVLGLIGFLTLGLYRRRRKTAGK